MYRCLLNFKDINALPGAQYLSAGQEYKGEHADEFLALGFIKEEAEEALPELMPEPVQEEPEEAEEDKPKRSRPKAKE